MIKYKVNVTKPAEDDLIMTIRYISVYLMSSASAVTLLNKVKVVMESHSRLIFL